MTKLQEVYELGQSIWYDNLRRLLIQNGEMQALIDAGVVGVTSNPSIFEKAIGGSDDYDEQIQQLVAEDKSVQEIYDALVLQDIGETADLFRPVYDKTNGGDGYVSLEVSPTLAYDTAGTIADARRYFAALGRPNIMIKIPGTAQGVPAIRQAISEGINVNVTLLFSLSSYQAVANAYIDGLTDLAASGGDVSKVASVASFFVSRVDAAVDPLLEEKGNSELQGQIAIANAKVAYEYYHKIFEGPRWEALVAKGAKPQRLLWASTSTKDPAYPDTLYVDSLIGPDTVNTIPADTLDAFREHGTAANTLADGSLEAAEKLVSLTDMGISMVDVTDELEKVGVKKFAQAFESLMGSIEAKRKKLAEAV